MHVLAEISTNCYSQSSERSIVMVVKLSHSNSICGCRCHRTCARRPRVSGTRRRVDGPGTPILRAGGRTRPFPALRRRWSRGQEAFDRGRIPWAFAQALSGARQSVTAASPPNKQQAKPANFVPLFLRTRARCEACLAWTCLVTPWKELPAGRFVKNVDGGRVRPLPYGKVPFFNFFLGCRAAAVFWPAEAFKRPFLTQF